MNTQDSNPGIAEMSFHSSCVLQGCARLSPQKTGYMVGDSAIHTLVLLDPSLPFFLPLATFHACRFCGGSYPFCFQPQSHHLKTMPRSTSSLEFFLSMNSTACSQSTKPKSWELLRPSLSVTTVCLCPYHLLLSLRHQLSSDFQDFSP